MTAHQPTTSKRCSKCGETKPLEAFGPKKSSKGGRRSLCKSCRNTHEGVCREARIQGEWREQRRESGEIGPDTRILDEAGRDWAWFFVIFRDVPGWPGYRAGSDGSVWCCRSQGAGRGRLTGRWKALKPGKDNRDYLAVTLQRNDGRPVRRSVHRVVMESFWGPPPPGDEVCHNNGDGRDCCLRNLRYDTRKGNMADKVIHGTLLFGSRNSAAKLKEEDIPLVRSLAAEGVSFEEIGRRFGVTGTAIGYAVKGKTWNRIACTAN